jgi:hypothetical protein
MNGRKTKRTNGRSQSGCGTCWCEELSSGLKEFLRELRPPLEARRHFDSARIEVLKGLRAILDARIAHVSSARAKGEKIRVE